MVERFEVFLWFLGLDDDEDRILFFLMEKSLVPGLKVVLFKLF